LCGALEYMLSNFAQYAFRRPERGKNCPVRGKITPEKRGKKEKI